MTDQQKDHPTDPNPIEASDKSAAPVTECANDRMFLRLSYLNTILAVAGVFTGAVALWAALQESEAVRKQSAAAVWPYLQLSTTDYVDEDGAYFAMALTNAGIGPARVETMYFRAGETVARDWGEIVSELTPEGASPSWGQSFIVGRVLRPGERAEMFSTRDDQLAKAFTRAAVDPANQVSICYCSIFNECWLASTESNVQRPELVNQCPDYGEDAFRY